MWGCLFVSLFFCFWHLRFVSFLKARSGFSVLGAGCWFTFVFPALFPNYSLVSLSALFLCPVRCMFFLFVSSPLVSQPDLKDCKTDGE